MLYSLMMHGTTFEVDELYRNAGAALCTFLRPFRGVHKAYLQYYVATYEALVNAKRVSPHLICRMCWPPKQRPYVYWT
jgi:hypothetical protein